MVLSDPLTILENSGECTRRGMPTGLDSFLHILLETVSNPFFSYSPLFLHDKEKLKANSCIIGKCRLYNEQNAGVSVIVVAYASFVSLCLVSFSYDKLPMDDF